MHNSWSRSFRRIVSVALPALALTLSSCVSQQGREPVDPDAARARIASLLPGSVKNRAEWAMDIFAAFEALKVPPSDDNTCAVVAVTQQESTFQVDPPVPGLSAIAWREIDGRAARFGIPKSVAHAALQIGSPNGKTFGQRIDKATTEKELSEIFEDLVNMVPLGSRLFADWNPVRTGGPMQVSIAFAEEHAKQKTYPYPMSRNARHEVFTRRGGLYFGMAHLLDYPAAYDGMVYRFADFNAGHYAARNAAFQNAVSVASKKSLVLDGDLLRYGAGSDEPSKTELAVRSLAGKLDMTEAAIRRDLEQGKDEDFDRTQLYKRVFALAQKNSSRPLPKAMLPRIRLQSAKITRKLTTEWFANRVNERYKQCLQRASK